MGKDPRPEYERLFEYPFNFQEYVERRLRDIDDLEERQFAKMLLQDGLMNIIHRTEESYNRLEQRVQDEIESSSDKYQIYSTIIDKNEYDPTNPTFFPVCIEDVKKQKLDEKELVESIANKKAFPLFEVYLVADDKILQALESDSLFHGVILTSKGEHKAVFRLTASKRYLEKIAHLYELYNLTGIPWTTVNCIYLEKFYQVSLENVDSSFSPGDQIRDFQIDFGPYTDLVLREVIPLWNVEKIQFSSADFVMPCIDSKNYEHEFPIKRFGINHGYLIEKNEDILHFRFEKNKIFMVSHEETFENWTAYKLVSDQPVRSLNYNAPIYGNKKADNFVRRMTSHFETRLQTRAELIRKIKELDTGGILTFQGFEILEKSIRYPILADMNWFIQDELFDRGSRRILLLRFQATDPVHYQNDAMVRFVTAQLQLEYGEYRCVGVLV